MGQRRDEQRSLVLAITVARGDHGVRHSRLIAADSELYADVPDVLSDPPVDGSNGVIAGLLTRYERVHGSAECRRRLVSVTREIRVPVRYVVPAQWPTDTNAHHHAIRVRSEWLRPNLRRRIARPHITGSPTGCSRDPFEIEVFLPDTRLYRRRHIEHESRSFYRCARSEYECLREVVLQYRLALLDREFHVQNCPGCNAGKRHPHDFLIAVDR